MIRVESITIKEFRGIRDLTLEFHGKNFAVCGPNGTGKSGIVDALEFALTGNISRLAGEGRGDVSLKEHGPHVDSRNAPSKAKVSVEVSVPSLGKRCVIERSVKNPGQAIITPDEPALRAVLRKLEKHPEIVLSRRELIKYVLATPGSRAKEVQALLQLDQVEKVRGGLQKAANSFEKHASYLKSTAKQESESLQSALGVTGLVPSAVLAATNARRRELGLPPIAELTATTSLNDGMSSAASVGPPGIPKAQTLSDIVAARQVLSGLGGPVSSNVLNDVRDTLTAMAADPAASLGFNRESFYRAGVSLIVAEACPLCDNEWDAESLRQHLAAKLKHLETLSARRKAAQRKLTPILALMRSAQIAINAVVRAAELAKPPVHAEVARDFAASCRAREHVLTELSPLADAIAHLATVPVIPSGVSEFLDTLEKVCVALPEPTKQDAARDWLTLAQERLDRYRRAHRELKVAQGQADTARKVSESYQLTCDRILTGLYTNVQNDFSAMYAWVNRTDEDKFKAELTPSMGKLGFDVDFYGRGFFPPGAYHSEGHQDGMGLCLYLALMRDLHGSAFTVAVLDDVLMSVDSGHRREVCALLKKEFPQTQFIMTTHDPIWLKHMQTEELVESRGTMRFGKWSVEHGPGGLQHGDVWVEIEGLLQTNGVRAAAALLRHHLEYEAGELCHRLRAQVEFHGDAQYQLGELLPSAIGQLKKLLGEAKNAANSWNNKDLVDQVASQASSFSALSEASKVEQWQVNAAVHYNSWATFERNDFAPVASAFRELLDGFRCSQCHEFLRVSPGREKRESLRCECGKTQLNLLKK